jgi:short subunit dehydrogenase-like uncharacterized protein
MSDKPFEIIVYGATSFVGKILCHYLVDELADPSIKWAMAGRSESKMNELKQELGESAANVACLIASADDEDSLRNLCNSADVIISTVGPYALYGETLVKVCAETGTDYCDLTGEPQWIRLMIEKYQDAATKSGARIVPSCGFDSIPSDLGTYFLQQHALQQHGHYCGKVKMRVKGFSGGASGGTIASMVNVYKEAAANPQLRKELSDLYSICPESYTERVKQKNVNVQYDQEFESWAAPFVMAAINTRIVLRTNALLDPPYKNGFVYDEAMLTGDAAKGEKRAKSAARGSKMMFIAMAVPPVRWVALKFLPKPGEGPTPEQQLKGYYDLRFFGATDSGETVRAKVTGDRDPGYGSTGKMLAQAGLCLARDRSKDELAGGFWTPASAMGDALIQRLSQYAGLTFEIEQ